MKISVHCASEKINPLRQLCHELYQMAFQLESQSRQKQVLPSNVRYIEQQLKEEIVEHILLSLPGTAIIKPQKVLAKRASILKNVEEFMIDHIKSDATIKNICDELNISQRNLEYIFKDFYGVSPKDYFKRLRLNALNKKLQQRPKQTNISAIAYEYGFFHRGRLAKDYQKLFGELPSETLRK